MRFMPDREAAPPTLVLGGSGLVGGALLRTSPGAIGTYGSRPFAGGVPLDVRDLAAVRALVQAVQPSMVYFAAANGNVEWCEQHPDDARLVNVVPPIAAVDVVRELGARFVFFSSEYVFDGRSGPYYEFDERRPLSVYGRHKSEVEDAVLARGETVIRTTTVYGAEHPPGKNFALQVLHALRLGSPMRVASDQVSTPTWADQLAAVCGSISQRGGVWHVAGPDLMSRPEFARLIADVFTLDPGLIDPTPTRELGQSASRPLRAGLRTDQLVRAIGQPLPTTRACLDQFRVQMEQQ